MNGVLRVELLIQAGYPREHCHAGNFGQVRLNWLHVVSFVVELAAALAVAGRSASGRMRNALAVGGQDEHIPAGTGRWPALGIEVVEVGPASEFFGLA